jgi:hypothetical protein
VKTPSLREIFVQAALKLRAEYQEACVEPHPPAVAPSAK